MSAKPVRRDEGGRRSAARLGAIQALYQLEIAGGDVETVIGEFILYRFGKEIEGEHYQAADANWFAEVVRGVTGRQPELDALLNSVLAKQGGVDRLEALLRATLRAGAFELIARADVPARVVIDEYVDVAHAFFGGPEPGLINGVLDRLARQVRAGEMKGPDGEPSRPVR